MLTKEQINAVYRHKAEVLESLLPTLQMIDICEGLQELLLVVENGEETVYCHFELGDIVDDIPINVTADSELAMIYDVVKGLLRWA